MLANAADATVVSTTTTTTTTTIQTEESSSGTSPFIIDIDNSRNGDDTTDAPSGEGTVEFVPDGSEDDDNNANNNNNNNSSSSVVISGSSSDDNSTLTTSTTVEQQHQPQQPQQPSKPIYEQVIISFEESMACEPWMFPQERWEQMLNEALAQVGVTGFRWTQGYDRQHIRRRKLQYNAGCPDWCMFFKQMCGCGHCISGVNCPEDLIKPEKPETPETPEPPVDPPIPEVTDPPPVDPPIPEVADPPPFDEFDTSGTDTGTGTDTVSTDDGTGSSDDNRKRYVRGRDLEREQDNKDDVSLKEDDQELRMRKAMEDYEKLQKRYEDYYHPNKNGKDHYQDERRTAQVAQFIKDEQAAQDFIDLDLTRLGMDVECLKRQDDGQYHARVYLISKEL